MFMDVIAQFLFGLSKAAILFLIACGLSIIFGMLNVVNFAHGSLFMFGGFFAISLIRIFGYSDVSLWVVLLLVAPLCVALLGIALKYFIDVSARGTAEIVAMNSLIFTIGLAMIFSDLARTIWGADVYSYLKPSLLTGSLRITGVSFPYYDVFNILLIVVLGSLLTLLFFKTKIGAIIRAIAYDERMASAIGIDTKRISLFMFMLGAFLAGLGGAIGSMVGEVNFMTWEKVIVEAFVVAVIGGLGSFRGALIGALIIGVTEAFAIFFFARLGPGVGWITMFIVLAIVLLIRPRGIFGGRF
ncbi:MAG: branched-chain amino acid ABC transporter permease [Candidatus Bathyarchaeia archaeon]